MTRPISDRALLILLAAITALGPIATNLYLPALPSVREYFGASVAEVQATFSVSLVLFAFGILTWGPVSDRFGRRAAILGGLTIMVGGEEAVFERVRPLLECFATEITHCGALGSGQVVKILNNMVLFETVAALSEARAIAARAGVDARLLFETLAKGSADSFALRNHGLKAIIPGDFPLRAFSVEYALKDLEYALELAAEAGVDVTGAQRVEKLFHEAIDRGLGARYHPVISTLLSL